MLLTRQSILWAEPTYKWTAAHKKSYHSSATMGGKIRCQSNFFTENRPQSDIFKIIMPITGDPKSYILCLMAQISWSANRGNSTLWMPAILTLCAEALLWAGQDRLAGFHRRHWRCYGCGDLRLGIEWQLASGHGRHDRRLEPISNNGSCNQ